MIGSPEATRDHLFNPYAVWFELTDFFRDAWDADPPNMELIDRIYGYSEWCMYQPEGTTAQDDLGTVVAVCFFEHIPETPQAIDDLPNRWTRADMIRSRGGFSYIVGPDGFQRILDAYDKPRARRARHSR